MIMGVEVASIYATLGLIDKLTPALSAANTSLSGFATKMGSQLSNFREKGEFMFSKLVFIIY